MSCIQLPYPQHDVFPCAVLKWLFGFVKIKLTELWHCFWCLSRLKRAGKLSNMRESSLILKK